MYLLWGAHESHMSITSFRSAGVDPNAFDNLATSCGPCNQSKGPKLLVGNGSDQRSDLDKASYRLGS